MNLVKPEDKITFGKYLGKSFDEIAGLNPEYIIWLHEEVKSIKFEKEWIESVQQDAMENEPMSEYDYASRD
jgi:hypothetical protein